MAWLWLGGAILFEVAGTLSMKLSDGFERRPWAVAMAVGYTISLICLTRAVQHFEIGVAYAVWSGAGILLITLAGAAFLDETLRPGKLVCIALIVAGIAGLELLRRGE